MARYIDADKLAEYITTNYCKNCDIYDGEKCLACGMNDALNFIETFETADVVPKSEIALEVIESASEFVSIYAEEAKKLADNEEYDLAKFEFIGNQIGALIILNFLAKLKKKYTEDQT